MARSGERVRLTHVRFGGRVFTRALWIQEFGERLAAADTEYFAAREQQTLPPRDPEYGPPSGRGTRRQRNRDTAADLRHAEVVRMCEAEGL